MVESIDPQVAEWPRQEDWAKLMRVVDSHGYYIDAIAGRGFATAIVWFGMFYDPRVYSQAPIEWWTPGFEMPYKNDNRKMQ